MRTSNLARKTAETDIKIKLNLDGSGKANINTGCGFLNHMLTLFAKHGRFDLDVLCVGDIDVDYHHSVEDIGISLGDCFIEALGDLKGITRYADTILPMDESLILSAVDISGRDYLNFDVKFDSEKIGDFDTELVEEFFYGFVRHAKITLHIKKMYGKNSHHIAEGIFKSVAHTFKDAVKIDEKFADDIPSTKGVLV